MEFQTDTRLQFKDREEMFLFEIAANIMRELVDGIVDRANSVEEGSIVGLLAGENVYADEVQAGVGEDAIGWCRVVLSNMRKRGTIEGYELGWTRPVHNRQIGARLMVKRRIEMPTGDRLVQAAFRFSLNMERECIEFWVERPIGQASPEGDAGSGDASGQEEREV